MKRATALGALLIIAAVGLGACSGATATPAASAGSPPVGTYTAQTGSPPDQLTLLAGGRYRHDIPLGDLHLVGTWTATQAQLSFTETAGGPCADVTGTYTWSYNGTALHLTVVSDACIGRPERFGGSGGWAKQP